MYFFRLFLLFTFTLSLNASPQISTAVKEKRLYPMGKKVYEKLCTNIEPKKYETYEIMQTAIKKQKLCKPMRKEYFQALSIYLWDKKRVTTTQVEEKHIHFTKDDKCPVCGMYVYKYPKWITQIVYAEKHYSFDGVKDMMKFYFSHDEDIKEILVRDYYTQKVIDAKKAFYVLGSDVYGPMGHELIAFKTKESAKVFYFDHRATKILSFDMISFELIDTL